MTIWEYDDELRRKGYTSLCGVDEAGRGPLAGPVFAAAVIFPKQIRLEGLNDSKKLTEKKREALYDQIVEQALWCVGSADEGEIDQVNILNATFLAMGRAYEGLLEKTGTSPSLTLVDGNRRPPIPGEVHTVVKGDGLSACIAAASILAKVSRDRYLYELDRQYPQYQFARHKGYGTKIHYQMLGQYGPSPVHRKTFLKKWEAQR